MLTATATDAANNTSEFSLCLLVQSDLRLNVEKIGNEVRIAWSTNMSGSPVLEQTENLAPPIQWTQVTNTPAVVNAHYLVSFPAGTGQKYFLLHQR